MIEGGIYICLPTCLLEPSSAMLASNSAPGSTRLDETCMGYRRSSTSNDRVILIGVNTEQRSDMLYIRL